jgi:hypothetical protein
MIHGVEIAALQLLRMRLCNDNQCRFSNLLRQITAIQADFMKTIDP